MFIIWGTKVLNKRLGRVADFCPICRGFQPFMVSKVETVGHLYYIPLGRRKTVGMVEGCENCSLLLQTDASEHEGYSSDRTADVTALIATTNPRIMEKKKGRIDLEKRARDRQLTTEERSALMIEPFLLLNSWTEDRGKAIEKDGASVIAGLCMFALPIGILVLAASTGVVSSEVAKTAAISVGGVLLVLTIYLTSTIGRRFARRVLVPQLAQTVRPLNPSREELEDIIHRLKQKKLRIGKLVNAERLYDSLSMPAS